MKSIILGLFCISLGFTGSKIFAQEADVRVWTGYRIQIRPTKEWRIAAGQTFMFSGNPSSLSTIQNQVNVTYRINNRLRAGFGLMKSVDPDNWREEGRNRLTVRFNAQARIDGFRINNSLRAEWNTPERSKYEYRIRYAFRIHNRNWKLPLRARPFINNEFQYYLSGKLLWYRDELGERVVQQSPDGLHAHRITLGVRFRLMKRTYMTVSYMKQTEFNIGNEYRRINVKDPRNGRIRRRFNNFSVFNFNVSHRLKS